MQFNDEVVGGIILIRPAIQSPNYVSGASGWAIKIDGSAEFTGSVIVGGEIIGAVFKTAETGNRIEIYTDDRAGVDVGVIDFYTDTATDLNGTITAFGPADGTERALVLIAPAGNGATDIPRVNLTYEPGVPQSRIDLDSTRLYATADSVYLQGQIEQYDSDVFTSYVPVVSGGGTATFTTRTGYYQRIGKMIFFCAYIVVNTAGSGATPVSITAPTSIDRSTRQVFPANGDNLTGYSGPLTGLTSTLGSGSTIDVIRNTAGSNLTGAALLAGGVLTFEGWYRET